VLRGRRAGLEARLEGSSQDVEHVRSEYPTINSLLCTAQKKSLGISAFLTMLR
jgi:hypothetical protein